MKKSADQHTLDYEPIRRTKSELLVFLAICWPLVVQFFGLVGGWLGHSRYVGELKNPVDVGGLIYIVAFLWTVLITLVSWALIVLFYSWMRTKWILLLVVPVCIFSCFRGYRAAMEFGWGP